LHLATTDACVSAEDVTVAVVNVDVVAVFSVKSNGSGSGGSSSGGGLLHAEFTARWCW
jgi:hypothetical protein